jgi:hypothetical protein
VRTLVGQAGLLYVGDCKMAALETRAAIAFHRNFSLSQLPLTGETATQFAAWVEAAMTGAAAAKLVEVRVEDQVIARG